jgi:phosphoribosylaminoimidazolecarboxamide formyltransferase/IMP cyclohydrolase
LHPKVFGGILGRRQLESDRIQMEEFALPSIDVVVVDLYPFEETLEAGGLHSEIIEKIDIGGISLIRAAAKNYQDTWIIPSRNFYAEAIDLIENQELTEDFFGLR